MSFERFSTLNLEDAAQALLGAHLRVQNCLVQIVEVEAYGGKEDAGSHAYRGKTPRNHIMFQRPGLLYMYFNYGVHWMANITCLEPNTPGAILIRAAKPLMGIKAMQTRRLQATNTENLLSGPGKFTQALGLNGANYGNDVFEPHSQVRLILPIKPPRIITTTRIGLAPHKGAEIPRRFLDADELKWSSTPKINI